MACPSIPAYPSDVALVAEVKSSIATTVPQNNEQKPHVICHRRGAVDLCCAAGLPESDIMRWDMAETARGGPFTEIAAADVFVNCIYLSNTPIKAFITRESLCVPGRRLRVACNMSCDPNDPNNPVPLYQNPTTSTKPTASVGGVQSDGPELMVAGIDHLPSLVAREASDTFSTLLLPRLLTLDRRREEGFWVRAEKLLRERGRGDSNEQGTSFFQN